MKCPTAILLAACVTLFTLDGRASAAVIIDEPFDANSVIQSPVASARIGMDMMGMWMGGTTMADGMWRVGDPVGMYYAMGYVNMAMGMDAGMAVAWNSMVYFVAKPQTNSWGGRHLLVSFDYQATDFSTGLLVKWGVYGWQGGESVPLGGAEYPGGEGTALIEGELWNAQGFDGDAPLNADGWHNVTAGYIGGDLDRFNYIGAAFTIGDTTADDQAVSMKLDNIHVEAIPEPTSMLLWLTAMAATAGIRRRLKKHRRATGPPG